MSRFVNILKEFLFRRYITRGLQLSFNGPTDKRQPYFYVLYIYFTSLWLTDNSGVLLLQVSDWLVSNNSLLDAFLLYGVLRNITYFEKTHT